jgi:16S rRNA (cytosine967-C5)-methyltransferase
MPDHTREAALDLLISVLDRRRSLEEALGDLPAIEQRDRAAAHRLAAAVLRRKGTLDAVLDSYLRRTPPELVRRVLEIGTAGLLLLDTADHAAVATAVALARSRGLAPFAGLVNAVLRRVAAAGAALLEGLDGPRLDTPRWLWASWGDRARAIATAHQTVPPIDVTLKPGAPVPDCGEMLPTGSVRFPPGTHVRDVPGLAEGSLWVQDAAAAIPARLLDPRPAERIGDLCAAPGGKTAQLATAGAKVTAVERDPKRIERLKENLGRWDLSADIILADAADWRPHADFDAILLDAPCSATGTIRRHPDISHLKRPQDVNALAKVQDRLLAAAADMLRPGGRLIYAVCSLQPEEGRARIEAALRGGRWRQASFTEAELVCLPDARTPEGDFRTDPGMWSDRGGMDGFYAARLIRL